MSVSLSIFLHLICLERGTHSLNLELTDWPGQLTVELLGHPPVSASLRLASQVYALCLAFHMGARGPNSGPRACEASTLLTAMFK